MKRIKVDHAHDRYVATWTRAEIAQITRCITGNTNYLGHVPSHRCIPNLVRKLSGFETILAPVKKVEA